MPRLPGKATLHSLGGWLFLFYMSKSDVDFNQLWCVANDVLPPLTAKAVWLHFGEGLTQSEVAQELGTSRQTVNKLIRVAKRTLKDELNKPRETPASGHRDGPLRDPLRHRSPQSSRSENLT